MRSKQNQPTSEYRETSSVFFITTTWVSNTIETQSTILSCWFQAPKVHRALNLDNRNKVSVWATSSIRTSMQEPEYQEYNKLDTAGFNVLKSTCWTKDSVHSKLSCLHEKRATCYLSTTPKTRMLTRQAGFAQISMTIQNMQMMTHTEH